MDEEKLERRERDFWESKREAQEKESGGAGRHKMTIRTLTYLSKEN